MLRLVLWDIMWVFTFSGFIIRSNLKAGFAQVLEHLLHLESCDGENNDIVGEV